MGKKNIASVYVGISCNKWKVLIVNPRATMKKQKEKLQFVIQYWR